MNRPHALRKSKRNRIVQIMEGLIMDSESAKRKPMKIIGTAIDCENEIALADFYAEMLGWTKTFSGNGFAVISSAEYPSLLVFQAVENY